MTKIERELTAKVGSIRADELLARTKSRLGISADVTKPDDALRFVAALELECGPDIGKSLRRVLFGAEDRSGNRRYVALELVNLFARALGDEKAQIVVHDAAQRVGLRFPCEFDQAADLLERIASTPGIVGVTARFAKARLAML